MLPSRFGSMASDMPQRLASNLPSSIHRSPFEFDDEVQAGSSGSSGRRGGPGMVDNPDEAVRGTDSDASLSRLSAVKQGYLVDPYAEKLIRGRPSRQTYLRPPLINLGTHARTWAVDQLVESFLRDVVGEGEVGQIVSLGAGSDTRFWRLQENELFKQRIGKYVELDFEEITAQKTGFIARSPLLATPIQPLTLGSSNTRLDSPTYNLLPIDLRQPTALSDTLTPLLNPSKPTLWIAECLLVYLPVEVSDGVVRWFEEWSGGKGWVGGCVYEMTGFEDAFGKRMVQNLSARNIPLLSSSLYPTMHSQPERFVRAGFPHPHAGVCSINEIRSALPQDEAVRVRGLEMLDEVEEMELLFEHYGVSWGSRQKAGEERPAWGLDKLA